MSFVVWVGSRVVLMRLRKDLAERSWLSKFNDKERMGFPKVTLSLPLSCVDLC